MIWTFIIFLGLALAFVKLGAYSVWMVVFSGGLKLAVAIIIGMVIWMIFRTRYQKFK